MSKLQKQLEVVNDQLNENQNRVFQGAVVMVYFICAVDVMLPYFFL